MTAMKRTMLGSTKQGTSSFVQLTLNF